MRKKIGSLFAGLVAGLLTLCLFALLNRGHVPKHAGLLDGILLAFGALFALGAPFGVLISMYLRFSSPTRITVARMTAFFVACGIANTLAWFLGIWLAVGIHNGGVFFAALYVLSRDPEGAVASLFGGAVGAALIVAAAVLVFSRARSLWDILRATLSGLIIGGLLGLFGWEIGSRLERATPQASAFITLFLVWQSGMGLLLPSLVMNRQSSERIQPAPSNDLAH